MQPESMIGLLISALALSVAAWSAMQTHRTASRQTNLQERLFQLETNREAERQLAASKAILRAEIMDSTRSKKLNVKNSGASAARDVRVLLDGVPVLEHDLVPRGLNHVDTIGPGATVGYLLAPTMGSRDVVSVRLEWEDGSGGPGAWESQLKVF